MVTVSTPNGFSLDNSGRRIVVDPVTRIEGHMRVEVNVDENNVIRNAGSAGTRGGGVEVIVRGRGGGGGWGGAEGSGGGGAGAGAGAGGGGGESALNSQSPESANAIRSI